MPKLPINLVKPPAFDNPLRRTAPASDSEATASPANDDDDHAPSGVVLAIAPSPRSDGNSKPDIAPAPHRITVRIDDATRRALESDCYARRVAGEKTNIAEIARNILRNWANRTD